MGHANFRQQRLLRYVLTIIAVFAITVPFLDSVFTPGRLRIQHRRFTAQHSPLLAQPDRQRAVRREFLHAWNGYREHAWMADALRPISGTTDNRFCGWSATLVDTLDTLWIMNLKDEFDRAVEAVSGIDFEGTAEHCQINLFESTIRYLGGMLAAYDLSGDQRLLSKLVELGEILYGQFGTTNGMPCHACRKLRPNGRRPVPGHDVALADVGSFYLEFARLAQVTGDKKYARLVEFLTSVFESTQDSSSIPGLWPERVNASSIDGPDARFATGSFTYSLGALSDSAYEYLVKSHLLLGGITGRYAAMWEKASRAIRDNLLFRAYMPQWRERKALFAGIATHEFDSEDLLVEPRIEHLGCFAGGLFALSSKVFDKPEHLDVAIQLTEGCIWAYDTSPLGVMPETVTLLNCPDMVGPQCEWDQEAWDEARENPPGCTFGMCQLNNGYPDGLLYSIDAKYGLRPEAIESVFVLYRVTGDEYYRDVGWRMFQRIVRHTRTPLAHSALQNVMHTQPAVVYQNGEVELEDRVPQADEMESFWLGETLKYFWLLFSEPDMVSLDEWVLNTEAHPLRLTEGVRAY